MSKILLSLTIILTVIGVVFLIGVRHFQKPASEYPDPVEPLHVGTIAQYSTLILIAEDQGYFRENGLDVTTTEYDSGAAAFKELLGGKADIVTAADFLGVRNSFDTQDFKIITAIGHSTRVFDLVARKDHGIENPADLKGKKIGLTKKTMGEFFLGKFLTFQNLSITNISQINGDPAELSEALMNGTIDAAVTFHPYIYEIEKKLGNNATTLPVQNDQILYALLYARSPLLQERPDTVHRFLQALVKAEKFAEENPDELQFFFTEKLHYQEHYITTILSHFHYGVSLSPSMLLAMEDQARWIIENNLTDKTEVPNYLDFIYFDSLARTKPEAISIIR